VSIVAIVPARGGSKGIPKKNIRLFCGRPLLYWVCKAAEDCEYIAETIVSTDDGEIADAAHALGLSKLRVMDRPPETATDTASTESVLLDAARRVDCTHIALLQATSPLLDAAALRAGCRLIMEGACDSVLSVVRQKRFLWQETATGAVPLNYDPKRRPRRQDFDGFLVENGAFYITSRAGLLESGCRIPGRIRTVEMPEASYFEIDEHTDWAIAEQLLRQRLRAARGPLNERLRGIRIVITDVDGCLTDGGMYYGRRGDAMKKFNTRDGKAFELLRKAGIVTGIVTQENTRMVERRACKVRAEELHQGASDKVAAIEQILHRRGLRWEQTAYLGDDLNDLGAMERAAVAACPADAVSEEVRAVADLVLNTPGGRGAFRELAQVLLEARS
jgi:N-acylneuraminate cytidylyltransferase